jgi:hypothetical protein
VFFFDLGRFFNGYMDPAHILVWNVSGLNSPTRRDAVRVIVDSSSIDIVCLLETKMSSVAREHILSMLGGDFANLLQTGLELELVSNFSFSSKLTLALDVFG